MKIYEATANCLVDDCLIHWYILAKNDKTAWIKGYLLAQKSSVADGGTVDTKRIKGEQYEAVLQSIKNKTIQLYR